MAHAFSGVGGSVISGLLAASMFVSAGCTSGGDDGGGSGGSSAGSGGSSGGGGSHSLGGASGSCDPDPLRTNLPPLFNGNSVDMDDCPILKYTAKYSEPDAMIFKAIIYVESRFQYDAVGCKGNGPCCPAKGWTAAECACLGSMQTGPSCDGPSTLGLLPNGHVNMETDPSSSGWGTSVFNPEVNVELGVMGISGNRAQVKQEFPGCTEEQYTLMAIGNFNSYGSTKSCTEYNTSYDDEVLKAYKEYSDASGWAAHPY